MKNWLFGGIMGLIFGTIFILIISHLQFQFNIIFLGSILFFVIIGVIFGALKKEKIEKEDYWKIIIKWIIISVLLITFIFIFGLGNI